MESVTVFEGGHGLADDDAAVPDAHVPTEMPMPKARSANLRTRLGCVALLLAVLILASMFIGVPLASALRVLLYGQLQVIATASAIILQLWFLVMYVILKTEARP